MPFSLGSRQTSTSWCKTNTSCVWSGGHSVGEGSCRTWWLKFMDDKMGRIPSAGGCECYCCCLQARPDTSAGDPLSGGGISPVQVQRDKGRGTMWAPHSGTPPCPGRIAPLPARPPAHPRSAEGTPGDPAGAEDPHSRLTGGGAGGSCPRERGDGSGGGRVPPPPGGLGRGRAPSADTCRSLQPPAKQSGPDPARLL